MEHQSLITIAPWTFIFQILNLLLQAYLFKRFLFKPIKNIIAKRQAEINGLYTDAEAAKEKALSDKNAYDGKLAEAHAEAETILAEAKEAAREKGDAMVSAAKAEAAAIKDKAAADIQLEKKKAVNQMKDELAGLAVEIAEKVTEKELDAAKHTELIDQFIEKLGDDA